LATAFCSARGPLSARSLGGLQKVGFYRRFAFETTTEQSVLGVPNWLMVRRAVKAA